MGSGPLALIADFGTLGTIVQTLAIMMGLGLFVGGLFVMKKYGETRTFMSNQMSIAAPITMLVSGTMLLILPTVINTASFAFWANTSDMRYSGSVDGWDQYIPVVLAFVRLLGVGSMMRGIILFSRVGGHSAQPGTMYKALIHILGGILCIHIMGTVNLLEGMFNIL